MVQPTVAEFQLVRSFSDDICERGQTDLVGRGLSTVVAIDRQEEENQARLRDQWNQFLLEGRKLALDLIPDEEAVLLAQSQRLYSAWEAFCKNLPRDQREVLSQQKPSLRLLHDTIDKAAKTWQEKRDGTKVGKVKKAFTRLSEHFEAHSNLVSMFPTDEKYMSLLTGSLTAMASASTNHQSLADGVADSLEEFGEDIQYWNILVARYPGDSTIRRHLMTLYTVVFEFFTEIFVQWSKSSWKRFVASFDQQTFQKLFTSKRNRIKVIERRIERYIGCIQAQTEDQFRRQTEVWQTTFDARFDNHMHRLGEEVQATLLDRLRTNLLTSASQLLTTEDRELRMSSMKSTPLMQIDQAMPSATTEDTTALEDLPPSPKGIAIGEALIILKGVEDRHFGALKRLLKYITRAKNVRVSKDVAERLNDWLASAISTRLWVEGPYAAARPSQNTLTAAALVSVTRENKVPCLHYFASIEGHPANMTPATAKRLLLDMVRVFVVQLVLLGVEEHGGEAEVKGMTAADFEAVMNRESHFDDYLSTLQKLRVLVPERMYCFIEGFQALEEREDSEHSKNLSAVLRVLANLDHTPLSVNNITDDAGDGADAISEPSRLVKICLLSDGNVNKLAIMADHGYITKIAYEAVASDQGEDEGSYREVSWGDD